MKPIDLGISYDEHMTPSAVKQEAPSKHYPAFHYDGEQELDLPAEGEMVIKFRKTSSSVSEREDGKRHYSCTVEVREIVDVKEDEDSKPVAKYNNAEEALDKLMSEYRSKKA